MRRFIYQFHSWLGLVAALGLLVIGLTGSALVFKEEIDRLLVPELVLLPDPYQPRLDHDSFLANLQKALPHYQIVGWGKALTPGMADAVYAIPIGEHEGKMIHVDPSTGLPLGSDHQAQTFSDWLLELHYTFLGDHIGAFIVGLFGVILLLLGCSGVYLYRSFWKTLFQLRWKKSARIFFSDLHKMVGISSTVFNLVLGFTGAWWNLTHIIGHWIQEAPEPIVRSAVRYWPEQTSIETLVVAAQAKLPGYQANWVTLPQQEGGDVMMFGGIQGQGILRSPYGSIVVFDSKSGELKSAAAASENSVWAQALDAFRPLHFGNFGGLPIKIVWCIGGLTPAILAITGCTMWWKRKFRKKLLR